MQLDIFVASQFEISFNRFLISRYSGFIVVSGLLACGLMDAGRPTFLV